MALLNKTIPSLTGGVSQQPDSVRFDNQAVEQYNFYPSPAKGLIRRSPLEFISTLNNIPQDSFIHFVDRDSSEKYILVFSDGEVRAFDLDGIELPGSPMNSSYLSVPVGLTPKEVFRTLTLSDSTIIVNNTKTVGINPAPAITSYKGLVYVRQGNFGKTYTVTVRNNGGVVETTSFSVPDGSDASHAALADTSYIAGQLASGFVLANITLVQKGNILYFESPDDFDISTTDGFDDRALYGIKDKVQLFSDLPRHGPIGFKVQVVGATDGNNIASEGYYVESKDSGGDPGTLDSYGNISWEETIADGSDSTLDTTTLPQLVKRNSGGNFTLENAPFEGRLVGDEDSATDPGFVDETIESVFFWKNRLGFIYGESVSMSETGNLFNYYPTTIATLLAGDPVEFTVNSPKVAILKHAVPWQEQVVLTSDKSQFIIKSEGNLSNSSVSVAPATEFRVNTKVPPVVSGSAIYFSVENNTYTEMREFYLTSLTNQKDAANVTSNIPTYIPGDAKLLRASNTADTIFFVSEREPGTIYMYNYLWNGEQKVQSSWNKIILAGGAEIIDGEFVEDTFYVIVRKEDGFTSLMKIDVNDKDLEINGKYRIYLDYRVKSEDVPVVDNGDDTYTYTLPYDIQEDGFKVVDFSDTRYYGNEQTITDITNNTVTISSKSLSNYVFGNEYQSRHVFGTISIKSGQGQGGLSITTGRTHILKMLVNYTDTVLFAVEADINNRPNPRRSEFNGRLKGKGSNIFGQIDPDTGRFKSSIGAKNDTVEISIVVDGFLPASFQFVDIVLRYNSSIGRTVQ